MSAKSLFYKLMHREKFNLNFLKSVHFEIASVNFFIAS